MVLLSVEAAAGVGGGDREAGRLPAPSRGMQGAGAVKYSADCGPGAYDGESVPDSAMVVLRRFYTDYIAGWLSQDGHDDGKERALLRQYLTPRMFDRLQSMYAELELDYDPFLEAQDCDESVLEKLRIERDSLRTGVYRVLLWDNYNRKYRKAELLLRQGDDGYRIDGILSLPDYYTRGSD